MLQLLLDVWMDFLVYGANRCSRESHAKKLSNGGELTMILWIMTERVICARPCAPSASEIKFILIVK
jgi:hypothetical protein